MPALKSVEPPKYDRRATQPRTAAEAQARDASASGSVPPSDEPSDTRESNDYSSITTIGLGVYLVLVLFLLVDMIVRFWPTMAASAPAAALSNVTFFFGLITLQGISADVRLILLAMVFGALGSCIHAAQSFATFVGRRTLRDSWAWWYILGPFIGSGLAVVVYVALRGALFPATAAQSGDMSPFGVAAIAGLAGMFSRQAVYKLNEVFTTAFGTNDPTESTGDGARKGKSGTSTQVKAPQSTTGDVAPNASPSVSTAPPVVERPAAGTSPATANGSERGDVPASTSPLGPIAGTNDAAG